MRRPPTGTAAVRLRRRRSLVAHPRRRTGDPPARTTPGCLETSRRGQETTSTRSVMGASAIGRPAARAGRSAILHRPPSARRRQDPGRIVHRALSRAYPASGPVPCCRAFVSEYAEGSRSSGREGFDGLDKAQDSAKDIPRSAQRIAGRQNGRPTTAEAGLAPNPLVSARRPPGGSPSARPPPPRQARRARAEHQRGRRTSSVPPSAARSSIGSSSPSNARTRRPSIDSAMARLSRSAPPGPRQHWTGARQVRRLDSVPRIDDPSPGQVRQDRIGVVRRPVVPLRDRGRSERQRTEFARTGSSSRGRRARRRASRGGARPLPRARARTPRGTTGRAQAERGRRKLRRAPRFRQRQQYER